MDFLKYAGKGNDMLDELAEELGFSTNRQLAFRTMKSTFHVLRDVLTIKESFRLIEQLPFIMKALYVEGWQFLNEPKKIDSIHDFVREMIHEDQQGHSDFQTVKDGENALMAVFKVLKNHISESHLTNILSTLPTEIWPLFGKLNMQSK